MWLTGPLSIYFERFVIIVVEKRLLVYKGAALSGVFLVSEYQTYYQKQICIFYSQSFLKVPIKLKFPLPKLTNVLIFILVSNKIEIYLCYT
jgi:hypothetical protein